MKLTQGIRRLRKTKRGRKLLPKAAVRTVQKLYARGLTMREVAAKVGISLGSVHKILSGNHPNQTKALDQVKREESLKLYAKLCQKYTWIIDSLPPLREIDWMWMKGKFLNVYTVIARRVNGVLRMAEVFAPKKEALAV